MPSENDLNPEVKAESNSKLLTILKTQKVTVISVVALFFVGIILRPFLIASKPEMEESIYLNLTVPAGIMLLVWLIKDSISQFRKLSASSSDKDTK